MRFSRHAKNKARSLGVSLPELEFAIGLGRKIVEDVDGNPIHVVVVRGMPVRVVIALDDSDFVITLFDRRKP
ncbi:MAG: hypothetical protein QG596_1864 [Actinomycetota bacterium]|jgi:hypothetical protein|nr:hypothetical protein [Actinomycetota bacterium]